MYYIHIHYKLHMTMLQFLLLLTYRWCFPVSSYINQFWIISIFQTLWKICYRTSGFCYVPLKSIDFFKKSVSCAHMIQRSFSDLSRDWKQNLGIFPWFFPFQDFLFTFQQLWLSWIPSFGSSSQKDTIFHWLYSPSQATVWGLFSGWKL